MGNAIPVSGGSELESELTTRVPNLRSNQFIAVASPDVTAPAHCCVRQLASRRRPTRQFGAIGKPIRRHYTSFACRDRIGPLPDRRTAV